MSTTSQVAINVEPAANPVTDVRALELPDPAEALPWLPCTVTLELPLVGFTIGDLSKLAIGTVVTTACPRNSDMPLYVNGQLIGWTELEVIEDRLAVRIMEIA